jgi:hypothetical protein
MVVECRCPGVRGPGKLSVVESKDAKYCVVYVDMSFVTS